MDGAKATGQYVRHWQGKVKKGGGLSLRGGSCTLLESFPAASYLLHA